MANQQLQAVHQGYTHRFEYRPEFLFGHIIKQVIDANVTERMVQEFRVAKIEDVFNNYNETFLVFGKPNTTLVTPKPDGTGYQKFAAYSVWRQASHVQDITRSSGSMVQSGIWLRFLDLPPYARERIREGMEKFSGQKFRTCFNGNMHVLEFAGFTSGKKPLSAITWPYQLMSTLLENGVAFEGKPVRFEIVRTTRLSMEEYTRSIMLAEITAPYRHFKKHPIGAKVDRVLRAPLRRLHKSAQKNSPTAYEVAPALPVDGNYLKDIHVRVTSASLTGQMLRQLWGPHAFFEALVDRVNVDDYLTRAMRPFPQKNPGFTTRLKKAVLFSRPVIWLMRKIMGASTFQEIGMCSERDIYDMLRTHSATVSNKYNIVIVRMPASKRGKKPITRFILSRITVKSRFVDWILSKHVLMSGYLWSPEAEGQKSDKTKPYVVWAGETWKTPEGKLIFHGNSGTYQPKSEEDDAMVAFTQTVFPHLTVEKSCLTSVDSSK